MEKQNVGKEKLSVPTDFTTPTATGNMLKPPSHFTSSVQPSGALRGVQSQATTPGSWITPALNPAMPVDPVATNPWLAITQAQQEILDLRKENQKLMITLHGESIRGRNPEQTIDNRQRPLEGGEQWSRWEMDQRLEVEKHKADTQRLRGQVDALKETAERHREEVRDKENSLSRQSREMEAMLDELCKVKADLSHVRMELSRNREEKERISSQFERLERESAGEIARLRGAVEKSTDEARKLALEADTVKLRAEQEATRHAASLAEETAVSRRKLETELQRLTNTYDMELATACQANSELRERLESMTSEVLQLRSTLAGVSAERDGLRDQLSQMGRDFETQSATIQSLRNYTGHLSLEGGEKERLTDVVERLTKEKEALQTTTELLTVRLNSINEILTLQEEKIVKKALSDPLLKTGTKGLEVLHLWRDKVFRLCIQLRSKDIEMKAEKDKHLSTISSMEQQLKQEQFHASVLQHSLDDRIAELDLERVNRETLKQKLAQALKENSRLKSWSQRAEAELGSLTEAVKRFSLAFETKVAEVDAAQTHLNTFTQRLTFANRRVETTQGLLMRKVALQKVQQTTKLTEQTDNSIRNLQAELKLACEERDKLAQELRRTPELVENALSDLREQFESKARQQQLELERCWLEVREAAAGRDEAQQRLREAQAQLEEGMVDLEQLRSQLLSQREHSEQALQQGARDAERRRAEQLREMEAQLNTARREHTKAVVTLRQLERQASREREQAAATLRMESEHARRELEALRTQAKETEMDKNLLLAVVRERGLLNEFKRARTAARRSSASLEEKRHKPPGGACSVGGAQPPGGACSGGGAQPPGGACSVGGTQPQLPARETLLSVLGDLQALSAAMVNSSEDSAEEEGEHGIVGGSTAS